MKSATERGDLVPSFEGEERENCNSFSHLPSLSTYTNDFSTSRCQEERFYVGHSMVYNVTISPFPPSPGVNFIKVQQAAFTRTDPESAKMTVKMSVFLHL